MLDFLFLIYSTTDVNKILHSSSGNLQVGILVFDILYNLFYIFIYFNYFN